MRRELPRRRPSRTFPMRWVNYEGKVLAKMLVTMGFYEVAPDLHVVAEVFVNGGKEGSDVRALCRDGAILISLALQSGVTVDNMRHSISRELDGRPQSPIGALLDAMSIELEEDERQSLEGRDGKERAGGPDPGAAP